MNLYDGRKPEPPYITDAEQAVLDERERCAVIAESLEWRLPVEDWISLSKKTDFCKDCTRYSRSHTESLTNDH